MSNQLGPAQPDGYYEMGFAFSRALPAAGVRGLQDRLQHARRIKLTGWTPFLDVTRPEWAPYPYHDFVEAWVGRPVAGQRRGRIRLSAISGGLPKRETCIQSEDIPRMG